MSGSGGSGETGRSPLTPGAVPAVRASATALSGAQPAGGLPDQGEVAQAPDRRGDAGLRGAHDRGEPVEAGLTGDHEGIEDAELGQGQLVERAQHGGAGGSPGRQLGRVVRGRRGEVGALAEQPGETVIGPPPQLLGQGA